MRTSLISLDYSSWINPSHPTLNSMQFRMRLTEGNTPFTARTAHPHLLLMLIQAPPTQATPLYRPISTRRTRTGRDHLMYRACTIDNRHYHTFSSMWTHFAPPTLLYVMALYRTHSYEYTTYYGSLCLFVYLVRMSYSYMPIVWARWSVWKILNPEF